MRAKLLAIDPGWNGAMAVFDSGFLLRTHRCQPTSTETYELVRKDLLESNLAVLEWVHSMPGQGVASTFKFGYNYGMWHGILASARKETMLVSPQMWQKQWDNVPKVKKDRKNFFKQIAREVADMALDEGINKKANWFEKVKVTNYNADAICIGQWFINKEL